MEELIIKYLKNETSPEEEAELKAWAEESESNKSTLEKYKRLWQEMDYTNIQAPDVADAWQKIRARIGENPYQKSHSFPFLKVAAAIALIVSAAMVYFFLIPGTSKTAVTTVKAMEKQQIALADGSTVWLNKGATLTYPEKFSEDKREVVLAGEGYFSVKKNPDKPFRVATKNTVTTVLGTEFNISATENGPTIISVKSGKVSFQTKKNGGREEVLQKDQEARHEPRSDEIIVSEVDPNEFAWQSGRLVFSNSQLPYVFSVLEEVYEKKFSLKSQEIKELSLNAVFEEQSLDEILLIMEKTLNIEIQQKTENEFSVEREN